ncbi:MAG: RNA polymerase sigma factor [Verrucomicrobiales bacterium]
MTIPEQHERFDQWVMAHRGILHRVANGFASGNDQHDLMQELLLAVWKSIPAFRQGAQPSTYIYRVSHNAAMTWQRKQKTYRRKVDDFEAAVAPDEFMSAAASNEGDPEILERIYQEIRKLSPVDRSLILLSLDGVSYREMASIHGLSESNVGARINRAKEKLSTALKEVYHELR